MAGTKVKGNHVTTCRKNSLSNVKNIMVKGELATNSVIAICVVHGNTKPMLATGDKILMYLRGLIKRDMQESGGVCI